MMAERTQAEWVELAIARSLPVSPVNVVEDLLDDPHVRAHALRATTPDGAVHMIAFPVRTDDESFEVLRRAPAFGEHTDEILGGLGETRSSQGAEAAP
jgi:crotonobetainyl-CoA:carnitine CoA-transferase CaiB-like acyl-CoA transferase